MTARIRFHGGPLDGQTRPFAEPLPPEVIAEELPKVCAITFRGGHLDRPMLRPVKIRYVLVRYTLGHGDSNPFYLTQQVAEEVRTGRRTIRSILGY